MRDIVPEQYYKAVESQQLLDAMAYALDIYLIEAVAGTLQDAQGVGSSPDLSLYAQDYAAVADVEELRAKMRGVGIVNAALLKQVAESYKHGAVEIVNDAPGYTVTIKFVGKLGRPKNLEALQADLRRLVPAHYAIEYQYKYRTWGELKEMTWGEVKTMTWGEVLNGEQS